MEPVEFAYRPPRQVAENLWEVRGDWRNKLGRRMTVIRLSDGRLILHSSIRLNPEDLQWLQSLGTPALIVAPNKFHYSDAGWMIEKFPAAQLFVPKSRFDVFLKRGFHPKDVNTEFPADIATQVKCIPMTGANIEEAAFLHVSSGTLILCDLAFNMEEVFSGLEKLVMEWNKVGGQFGPSRLTRLFFTKDRKVLIENYRQILRESFDRVIVSHGEILESQGKIKLKIGVERIFGPIG